MRFVVFLLNEDNQMVIIELMFHQNANRLDWLYSCEYYFLELLLNTIYSNLSIIINPKGIKNLYE